MWSRSESVRGLIPGQACSSSVKRRGPSERSCTSSDVHFEPISSAHAATAQVETPAATDATDAPSGDIVVLGFGRTRQVQTVSAIDIVAHPEPALAVRHLDYFGNHIGVYRIDQPHTRFDIEVRATVEVRFPDPPPAAETPPWETLCAALIGDGFPAPIEASEFIYESPLVPIIPELRAYGAESLKPGRPILEAAREITSRIKKDFEYHPGATDISTPLNEVFAGKAGVCQDFAHVMIAALRSHGLAAGYVSGYIRTVHSNDEAALRGADASHAWVAVWCGEGN